jgi:hypothetical protein
MARSDFYLVARPDPKYGAAHIGLCGVYRRMRVLFQDLQESANPLNGRSLESPASISDALRLLNYRQPFLFELRGDNGFMLTIGFAGNCGSIQRSPSDGSPPYLMAVLNGNAGDSGCVEFLAGNTPTPIPHRFCVPIEVVEQVASEFVKHGGRSGAVNWEEI